VKHINALFLIDQLSDLKFSVAKIIVGVINLLMSFFRNESWKINLRIFNAWIFELSVSFELRAGSRRKSRVLLSKIGSFERGSALSIARIVGGIPADLLRTVL
jgi:uncharacterized membrane protein